jgi:hypothetical protein
MSKQYKRKKKEGTNRELSTAGVVQQLLSSVTACCSLHAQQRGKGATKLRRPSGGYRSRDIRCVFFAPLPVGKRDVMDLLRHSRLMAFLFVIISFQIHDANAVPMVSYRVGNQLRLSPGW